MRPPRGSTSESYRRFRRVTSAATPRPNRIAPGLPPPASQQPPPTPAQHTPLPPPVSRQPKSLGQVFALRSHGIVHAIVLPSLAHAPAAQSPLPVHFAPRPPGVSGPAMHALLKQR